MQKFIADELALQLTKVILDTEPKAIIPNPQAASEYVADFVKNLSNRFQADLQDRSSTPKL